jgi:hypothetical protein
LSGKYSITTTSETNSVLKVEMKLKAPYNMRKKSSIIGMVFGMAYGKDFDKMEAVLSAKKGPMGWDKYGARANMSLDKFTKDPKNAYLKSKRDPDVWKDVKSHFVGDKMMHLEASRQFNVKNDAQDLFLG